MDDRVRRRRIRVTGRVQGVFFRASAADVAQREGATGWVVNNPDGSVQLEVQGPAAAVEAVESFCRRGPQRAVVQSATGQDVEVVEGEQGFEVR